MQDFFVNPIKESQDFLVTPKFYFILLCSPPFTPLSCHHHQPSQDQPSPTNSLLHQTDTMPTPPTTDYRLPLPPYLSSLASVSVSRRFAITPTTATSTQLK
jgi:hypothetical protein